MYRFTTTECQEKNRISEEIFLLGIALDIAAAITLSGHSA